MIIGAATIKLYAPWVHSLKEKRMVVKSIIAKVQSRFNISISEVDEQDIHQTIILGMACVAGTVNLADSIMDTAISFIENTTEAEILEIQREIRQELFGRTRVNIIIGALVVNEDADDN